VIPINNFNTQGRAATQNTNCNLEFFFPYTNRWYKLFSFSPKTGICAFLFIDITDQRINQEFLEKTLKDARERNSQLLEAEKSLEQISKVIPLCTYCNSIKKENDHWETIEDFLSRNSKNKFTHSICPKCSKLELNDLIFH